MARSLRDSGLETRAARGRLKPRRKPYYRLLEEGLHLGYRKPRGRRGAPAAAGKWVARHYVGDQKYELDVIAEADDFSDADGTKILNFAQAQEKVRERSKSRVQKADGRTGRPITVAEAMDAYIEFLDHQRKSGADARYRDRAFIRPKLGAIEAAALTAQKITKWHGDLAKDAPRLRTKEGKPQRYREQGADDESKRQRRASANRTLTVLKGALNKAWHDGEVPSDSAWRRVKPFKGVDAARLRYLTIDEAKRLINASGEDFRPLVRAALYTGARYSELARLMVADFNPGRKPDKSIKDDKGVPPTVRIFLSKSDKPRHVVLTDEGAEFFRQLCAGRAGSEIMLKHAAGRWEKSYQARPMAEACKRASIKPRIGFHILRHTWASHAVMNGVPLLVIARNLGHSDTRMVEKHYGHLEPSFVADAIRAGAPNFGFEPDKKVVDLTARQQR